MTRINLTLPSPAPVPEPRGAVWAAKAALALLRAAGAAWRAVAAPRVATGAPRSADALQALAGEVEREQPALAWEVRAIARHLRTFESNPGASRQPTGDAR